MLMLVMQRWILLVMRRRMPLNRDWEKTLFPIPCFLRNDGLELHYHKD